MQDDLHHRELVEVGVEQRRDDHAGEPARLRRRACQGAPSLTCMSRRRPTATPAGSARVSRAAVLASAVPATTTRRRHGTRQTLNIACATPVDEGRARGRRRVTTDVPQRHVLESDHAHQLRRLSERQEARRHPGRRHQRLRDATRVLRLGCAVRSDARGDRRDGRGIRPASARDRGRAQGPSATEDRGIRRLAVRRPAHDRSCVRRTRLTRSSAARSTSSSAATTSCRCATGRRRASPMCVRGASASPSCCATARASSSTR